MINIRRAEEIDIPRVKDLLLQVLNVHYEGRKDIFKKGTTKYTDAELIDIFKDDSRPVFVAVNDNMVAGYAFCIFEEITSSNNMHDMKTLYIDDLCVDESVRHQHIGTRLYEHVLDFAKCNGCYRVTLNVWSFNDKAISFYNKCGMEPLKVTMEKVL